MPTLLAQPNARGLLLATSAKPTSWPVTQGFAGLLLNGTAANDWITTPGGGATVAGGAGDDTYVIWDMRDRILERAGEGIDTLTVHATSFRLPDQVENMIVADAQSAGTGNALANLILGAAGSQTLDGGAGDDVLTGDAGADRFVFRPGTGWDVVTDFRPGEDRIVLGAGFAGLDSWAAIRAAMTATAEGTWLRLSAEDAVLLQGRAPEDFSAADVIPAQPSGLRATFADGFDGFTATPTGLDAARQAVWKSTLTWGSRTHPNNREVQQYNDATLGPDPFRQHDGMLDITAAPTPGLAGGLTHGSGLISSQFSHVQTYGVFEMTARLPAGQGFWPAFWMLRADGVWPSELDVMEMLGGAPERSYGALHSQAGIPKTIASTAGEDLTDGFHRFAVSWRPDFIRWYVDGTEFFSTPTPADMHSPMFMLANLAVGGAGSWPGAVAADGRATMSIDAIRAWQFADLAGPWQPDPVAIRLFQGGGGVDVA